MLSKIIDDVIPTGEVRMILLWGGLMILAPARSLPLTSSPTGWPSSVARDITEEVREDLY